MHSLPRFHIVGLAVALLPTVLGGAGPVLTADQLVRREAKASSEPGSLLELSRGDGGSEADDHTTALDISPAAVLEEMAKMVTSGGVSSKDGTQENYEKIQKMLAGLKEDLAPTGQPSQPAAGPASGAAVPAARAVQQEPPPFGYGGQQASLMLLSQVLGQAAGARQQVFVPQNRVRAQTYEVLQHLASVEALVKDPVVLNQVLQIVQRSGAAGLAEASEEMVDPMRVNPYRLPLFQDRPL